jgi:hypothetical protein
MSDGAAERSARRDAEMAAIRSAAIPPRATEAELKAFALDLVKRLAQIGKDHLQAQPNAELAAAVSDEGWRGLVPLFEGISAEMGATRYGHGFLLRFIESVLDVAKIAGPDALATIRTAETIRNAQSLGGTNGGGKAAKDRAKEWQDKALPFAREQRERNPSISQEALATEIKYQFDPPIGIAQIKTVIRGWERGGELTKRTGEAKG